MERVAFEVVESKVNNSCWRVGCSQINSNMTYLN